MLQFLRCCFFSGLTDDKKYLQFVLEQILEAKNVSYMSTIFEYLKKVPLSVSDLQKIFNRTKEEPHFRVKDQYKGLLRRKLDEPVGKTFVENLSESDRNDLDEMMAVLEVEYRSPILRVKK